MPSHKFNFNSWSNVSSAQEFLGNLKTAAQNAGWTIDKDTITSSGELYLHSTGNGSQNLYFC